MICKNYNAEISDSAKFCKKCGVKVVTETQSDSSESSVYWERVIVAIIVFIGIIIAIFAYYNHIENEKSIDFSSTSSQSYSSSSQSSGSSSNPATKTINGIECVLVKGNGTIKDFYIGKYEVTQKQYQSVMGTNPSSFKGNNLPVEEVTWYNADDFCRKVGGRLPTDAEWGYAAKGGNKSNGYEYSGSNNLNAVGWFYYNSGNTTHAVGAKQANELGIYDMSGNVREWCSDWHPNYVGSARVDRGGSLSHGAVGCRVANRNNYSPSSSSSNLGFRVAFNSSVQ